ncbi:hypothetical protein HJC23_008355 [Cyclotella cryptica]|uniref:Uncharacterized protein n=1 Tax=Cyclotella cryptica TaxID=29204 RepID=A0ABD3QAU6_9STRA|eukprot:CCRYP_008636-RC/>CCRYP_008636-RC protein AED:0.14 eAED:0.14 QI:240/1/1/1/1/1/3/99/1189
MRFPSAAFAAVLAASASTEAFHVAPSRATISRPRSAMTSPAAPARPFGVVSSLQQQELRNQRPHVSLTTLSLAGGGGPEALNDFIASQSGISKSSKVQNPKLVKLAGAAALPLTYLVGAAITPTRYLAAKALVGAVAAAAGGVGKSAIEEDVRKACPAAIAKRLLEMGVDGANVADAIDRLKDDYGVDDVDFAAMKVEMYAVYLTGMAKNPMTKTSELKELTSLKEALRLDNLQVGQAHADAAAMFYRDIQRTTSLDELDDEDHPDRISLDKLLFLSERAFVQGGETEEAFIFEFSRIAKILGEIDFQEAKERVRAVANPFYERALSSTRSKLESGAVSSDMLERARKTLGIDERDAKDMHIEAFGKEVRVQLGLSEDDDDDDDENDDLNYNQNNRLATEAEARKLMEKMMAASAEKAKKEEEKIPDTSAIKFKEGAFEHLSKLQEVLELPDEDAEYEIQAATADYWKNTALVAFRDAINNVITPAKCWDIIHKRQNELLLKDTVLKDMVLGIIMQTMGKPLEKVNGFARVNNAAATYDGLIDAIAAKEVCKAVCQQGGWEDFEKFEELCFDPNDRQSACGFIGRLDRQHMYNLFFGRSMKTDDKGRKILDSEARETLRVLRGMLGISDEDGENQIKAVFGPELNQILTEATEEILGGNVTPTLLENMKNEVSQVITDFQLDEEMKQQSALPLYEKAVQKISRTTPGGIPSKDEVETLKSLREFLDIQEEQTANIHLKYFGEAYRKGVTEALGTTGVIREEFRGPLDDLRSRLGVSDEAAKKIYIDAIGERMKPMVEYISDEMERTVLSNDQLARKRGADYGEDFFKSGEGAAGKLGLGTEGNIMGDIMNLIDFYVENGMIKKEVVGTKKVEKKIEEDGEEKTIEEEVPVYENTYPITATGKGWMDRKNAELCYRQFLVASFTEQGPNAARYDASKATFGGILGLTAENMEEIGSSIGGMVYDNYVTQALSTKEALDQQDMMFLANMQAKLGISPEQGEQMLLNTQKKIMSEEASALLDKPGKPPSPEELKAFREKCNSLGLDLEADVGLSRARVVNMFSMEIAPGIDSGEITMDSGDLIAEVQESLGLTEDEGEEVIANLIIDRAALLYVGVRSAMLRGLDVDALENIEKLIQYARFVDGELGLKVAEKDAWQAFTIYDNSDFTGLDEDTVKERKRLLKKVVGLPTDE